MRKFPLARVYQLIEPGPVVLLTTARQGRANVMAMSWKTMVDFEPPLIACIVGDASHSFRALRATRECVLAIPAAGLLDQVVAVGNCSGRDVDKFAAFGLTPRPAAQVAAPLVAECFANLECRVTDTRMVPRYGLFVLEVVRAWHDAKARRPAMIHHLGWGRFAIDGRVVRTRSRMR